LNIELFSRTIWHWIVFDSLGHVRFTKLLMSERSILGTVPTTGGPALSSADGLAFSVGSKTLATPVGNEISSKGGAKRQDDAKYRHLQIEDAFLTR